MKDLNLFIVGTKEFEEDLKKRILSCSEKTDDPEEIYRECFDFSVPDEIRESIIIEIRKFLKRRS